MVLAIECSDLHQQVQIAQEEAVLNLDRRCLRQGWHTRRHPLRASRLFRSPSICATRESLCCDAIAGEGS